MDVMVRAEDLTRLARDLKRQSDGPALRRKLVKEMRIEANKVVPPLRASIMGIPSHGLTRREGPPLRQLMARSVSVQIKTGKWATVRVFMSPKKMPDGTKGLPGYFEGIPGKEILRHPVYGNRENWVTEYPSPYFAQGVATAQQGAYEGVRRVMQETAKAIE